MGDNDIKFNGLELYAPKLEANRLDATADNFEAKTAEIAKNYMLTGFYMKYLTEIDGSVGEEDALDAWMDENLFIDLLNLQKEVNVRSKDKLEDLADLLRFMDELVEENQDPFRYIEIKNQLEERIEERGLDTDRVERIHIELTNENEDGEVEAKKGENIVDYQFKEVPNRKQVATRTKEARTPFSGGTF